MKQSSARPNARKAKLVGKVTHYYDKIGVAIVRVLIPFKKGDSIRIEGGQTLFSQKVVSMEKDHKKITLTKNGDEVGVKVKERVREGYKVYKV